MPSKSDIELKEEKKEQLKEWKKWIKNKYNIKLYNISFVSRKEYNKLYPKKKDIKERYKGLNIEPENEDIEYDDNYDSECELLSMLWNYSFENIEPDL